MNAQRFVTIALLLLAGIVIVACAGPPCVEVYHSPVIARSNESVTFTASLCSPAPSPANVEIYVNATRVHTCNGLSFGSSCTYTGGPYSNYISTTVSYMAAVIDANGKSYSTGYYYFGVTDNNYGWSRSYVPARIAGADTDKIDFIFHRAPDYPSVNQFITNAGQKINDIYRRQDMIRERSNFDRFNFYVYNKVARASDNCGGDIHLDASTDMPWKNVDALLHADEFQDCSSVELHQFSAEGYDTKAFLHESGHAVFGLADEYDAGSSCYTYYFEPASEPNIFATQARCQAEQTSKNRATTACREFTKCQAGDGDGWWGIHGPTDNTIMQRGMLNDPWGIEGRERVVWVSANPPTVTEAEAKAEAVMLVHVQYRDGQWSEGPKGARVLPCHPPVPILTGAPTNPLIQVKSAAGTAIYRRNIVLDPRIILWPDPSDMTNMGALPPVPYMLEELSFDLALPVLSGMTTLEYLVPVDAKGVQTGEGPALTVDLSQAIRRYEVTSGAQQPASCQLPNYVPDALR